MGGGVIRAASKVAGFGVPSGGIRSVAGDHFQVSRRAASLRPAASTAEEVKLVASNVEGSEQRTASAVDDWVFADGDGDFVACASMPRVVFGAAPTLQEAKEATAELSVALEKTFFSSASTGSVVADLSNSQMVEAKGYVGTEIGIASAVPSSTLMAFKFLKENPVAQNVVASVACDPNVWNAVLQNPELQGFLQSQQSCFVGTDDTSSATAKLVADSSSMFDQASRTSGSEDGKSGGSFFDKIKSTVVNMMNSLSDFFAKMFGGGSNGVGVSVGVAEASTVVGLAIIAIVVIVLKRG
ncbi:uncharacterized protein LOC127254865 isoform X1 [Andrographis paniculata]|uniref:uncharacterized protein LOC127254865 isoform X1 n=1 Tax=Andrographis paniculata TaxID=175694 RepID=UPI0021E97B93|nr:uncharacterized protein LOC127254865 isoform X1 [Andrographis paniculata]